MGDEQMGRPLKKPAAAPELMPLSIRSQSISHEVIRSLTKYFFSGGFAPGQRLPSERELAVSLGVPRSVVARRSAVVGPARSSGHPPGRRDLSSARPGGHADQGYRVGPVPR